MKRVMLIATAVAVVVVALMAGRATAQNANTQERTFLTFNTAVELPGTTLQPGTYVFKLADTGSRNVVQVWDQDEKHMIGHWTFVQAERPRVSEETVVMFNETRDGATPAVQYWYFPGEKVGKEFLYPKDQAERIAARTGAKVRTEDSVALNGAAPVDAGSAPAAEPAADVAAENALRDAPAASQPTAAAGSLAGNRQPEVTPEPAAPAPEPAPIAEAAPAPAPEPAPVEESRIAAAAPAQESAPRAVGTSGQADELPRTASPMALTGLLGLLSLAGAAGLRGARN
jgi:hypothetical protein